uniref:ATP-dependent DNA helicase n=1 Tax=Panagrellus redivivus TaxID=6233 RepID=A0A7E5A246_PANRE
MFKREKIYESLRKRVITHAEARDLLNKLDAIPADPQPDNPLLDLNDPPSPLSLAIDQPKSDDESDSLDGVEVVSQSDSEENCEEDLYERIVPSNEPLPAEQANFIYAGKFLSGSSSKAGIKNEIELASLTSGHLVNANASSVFRLVDTLASHYDVSTSYFCGKCDYPLLTPSSVCRICNTSAGRSLEYKPFGVATSSLIVQLEYILTKNIDFFLNPPNIDPSDRSELHTWHNSGNDGFIKLHLILNTDGVSPKQCFQGELNPVYASIGNLPAHRRGLLGNICCTSVITGRGKPGNEIWKIVVDDLQPQLAYLTETGITCNGIIFKLGHLDVTIDIMAANDIFASVGHCSIGPGCLKCFTLPVRVGNASKWPTELSDDLRTPESYITDAINHENGLKGLTQWYRIQTPFEWRVDGLHTLDKGIILTYKDIYLRTKSQVAKWNTVFMNGRYPDCTVFRPRTLEQSNRFTANDNRTVYFVLFPLIFYSTFEKFPITSATAFLNYLVLRHMASRYLNSDTIDLLIITLDYLGEHINNVFDGRFQQMKAHLLFVHAREDLRSRGTPYDYTTAPFEAMNRVIKVKYHPYDTRSLTSTIMKNLLAWKEWARKATNFLDNDSINPNFRKALELLLPKTRIKKVRYRAVKENGLFDNSVVRFLFDGKHQYGRILDIEPDGSCLIEPYTTRPLLNTFLDDTTLPHHLKSALAAFKTVISLVDLVVGLDDPIIVNPSSIVECCCSLNVEGKTYVYDLSFRGPSK